MLKSSRAWFAKNAASEYQRREQRWRLNLGFPGKAVGGSALAQAYRQVATTASCLASLAQEPTPELAASVRRRELSVEPMTSGGIELYPEIAAQLAGYVNSPHRRRGNLLLIDVGAGTRAGVKTFL